MSTFSGLDYVKCSNCESKEYKKNGYPCHKCSRRYQDLYRKKKEKKDVREYTSCGTCKHWGVHHDEVCDRVDTIMDIKDAEFVINIYVDDDQDDQLLDYHLRTGAKFGCIHHEEIRNET